MLNTDFPGRFAWHFELTYFFPHFMAVVFIVFLAMIDRPAKTQEFFRALLALVLATVLAHLDRWLNLWPEHLYFASGHMTFCAGIAISMYVLRPWTLAINLPVLVPYGVALYVEGFHTVVDIVGAIPLVACVYGIVYHLWKVPFVPATTEPIPQAVPEACPSTPPLDIAADSP